MVIIDTLYQLIDRDTANVSVLWKVLQIAGFGAAAVTGIAATLSFYCLLQAFDMNCILYPISIRFRNVSASDRKYVLLMQYINLPRNVTLDVARTEWRGDSLCKYCISMWMLSFIGGAILATFILLNPKGGTSYHHTLYSQPWKQVIPMFMVTIVILPFVSYSTFTTFGGILQFCAAFENYTGSKSCNKRIDVFSLKYNDEIHSVYALQHIVKASSGLVFTSWIFCTLILLIRICTAPDFELQVIVLTKKGKTCEFQPRMLSRPSGTYLSGLRSRTSIPSQSSIDKELPTLTTESGSSSLRKIF